MDCFIVSLMPNPVEVHDGDTKRVTVTITAMVPISQAALEIENRQPDGADVILEGDTGDKVRKRLGDLPAGDSDHTVSLGLRLQTENALSGAIIGLIARVVRHGAGSVLSPDKQFLGTIGAARR